MKTVDHYAAEIRAAQVQQEEEVAARQRFTTLLMGAKVMSNLRVIGVPDDVAQAAVTQAMEETWVERGIA
jgi:hypothetical protein